MTSTRAKPERWCLTLEAVGGAEWSNVPGLVRLRRALKALGRSYGLRCVAIEAEKERKDAA